MTECYRCGQEGHPRSQGPREPPLPPPPQPSGQAAIPARVWRDPAIARHWAQTIRQQNGWTSEGDDTI